MHRTITIAATLALSGAVSAPGAAGPVLYAVFDVGNPYGLASSAHSITTDGHVLVNFENLQGDNGIGIWSEGTLVDVTPGDTPVIRAYDLNDTLTICGYSWFWYENEQEYYGHAFRLQDGELYDLGAAEWEYSESFAINDAGVIVGRIREPDFSPSHATMWIDETTLLLPSVVESSSAYAYEVNNIGEVCGKSAAAEVGWTAAFWPDTETVIDLGSLNGRGHSEAWDINDLSQIVGFANAEGTLDHAFLWENGVMLDLGTFDTGSTYASAINNLSQVVGARYADGFGGGDYAILWQEELGLLRLSDFMPPKAGWHYISASDINDAGQIIGMGEYFGETRGYVASPVHSTITLSQPLPGLAGEVNTLTLSNCTPGTRVYLTYSPRGGGTIIPGCDIQENALQLKNAKLAGSVVADANGEGVFTFFVPDAASNLGDILIQAVVPGECAVSNLVVEGFE